MNENAIPLEEAVQWTSNWREKCPDNCKAFLVPSVDLIEVLQEMNILQEQEDGTYKIGDYEGQDIRAYMAIDPDESEGNGEKLLIVGTVLGKDGVYRDMVPGGDDGVEDEGGLVYDFTRPCPNNCDPGSPLFGS